MKKGICVLLAIFLMVAVAAGCAKEPVPTVKTAVNVGAIQGPTGIGMAHLMEADTNNTATNDYTFTVCSTPQDAGNQLASGKLDIAALPTNLAASLYQKTQGKVQLLAVNTLGVLYMLENGNTVQSIADLRGKTIYSTGEGANPEYILRYVLSKNGIDPDKDVTIKFLAENTELVAKMVSGEVKIAMVPEPNVSNITTKNTNVRIAAGMNDAWNAVADQDSKLMMGCVAVRKEFLENNKAAVDAFLVEYKASIEKATQNVEKTAQLCETYGIIPKAALAKKAIPNCQLVFVAGDTMKTQINGYYQVLASYNPKAIGGKLPDDGFYYAG